LAPTQFGAEGQHQLREPLTPLRIRHFGPGERGRERLEAFVREIFLGAYAARISTFYPHLVGITRPDASFAAVAGVRPAASQPLFAEFYLDASIETLISARTGSVIARAEIAEVGNLAPASAGQARWLIAMLTAYLYAAGFSWVVFTAVPTLYNAFARMGLRPIGLAAADVSRLDPALQDDWGSYYDAKPMVYAGEIRQGFQALDMRMLPELPRLRALWLDALHCGALDAGFFTDMKSR
jgi:hypothetical protein